MGRKLDMTAPYPGPAATPANDRTTLWGVLGIVFAFCCPILGAVFAFLSFNDAKKTGKPPTLAYVGWALAALNIVLNIVLAASGNLFYLN
jgi:hypothetical protein